MRINSSHRYRRLAAISATLALVVAACGDDESAGDATEPAASPAPTEPATETPEDTASEPEPAATTAMTEAPATTGAPGYMSSVGAVDTGGYTVDYEAANTDLKIGYSHPGDGVDFWTLVEQGMNTAAEEAGVELSFYNGKLDPAVAIENVQLMINEGVDAAIIYQCEAAANETIAAMLTEAQIPMVGIDCPVPGAVFFGGDNATAGSIGGEALAAAFTEKGWPAEETAVIYFGDSSVGAIDAARGGGYGDGFAAALPDFPAENIFIEDAGTNTTEGVLEYATSWIAGHPEFTYLLIGTLHDGPALGAYQAVQGAGLSENALIVSQGCDGSAQEFIRDADPVFIGSVDYGPLLYGRNTISLAIDLANGDPVPTELYANHENCDASSVDRLYPGG